MPRAVLVIIDGNYSGDACILSWARYHFQRPPPVPFTAKAPPISAPEVPMLTLAIPQSLPAWLRNRSASRKLLVMMALERPCTTPFCRAMAFSTPPLYFNKYKTGQRFRTISKLFWLRQWLVLHGSHFRSLRLPTPRTFYNELPTFGNDLLQCFLIKLLGIGVNQRPTWLCWSSGLPIRNCLQASTKAVLLGRRCFHGSESVEVQRWPQSSYRPNTAPMTVILMSASG